MDDQIRRRDAIDALYKMLHDCFWADDEELDAVIMTLNELQSAQRKGKWIYPTDIKGFGKCPHCKALWDYSLISNPFFKFCPRCGNGENELTELKGEEDVRKSDRYYLFRDADEVRGQSIQGSPECWNQC